MRIILSLLLFLSLIGPAFSQQFFEITLDNQSTETVHFSFRDNKHSLESKKSIKLVDKTWDGTPFYFWVHLTNLDSENKEATYKLWFFSQNANRTITISPQQAVLLDSNVDELRLQKYLLETANGQNVHSITRKFIKENRGNETSAQAIALRMLNSIYDVEQIRYYTHMLRGSAKTGWAANQIEKYIAGRNRLVQGKIIPPFSLTGTAGTNVSLNSFKSKYILLNFWASSCKICYRMFPDLKEIYELSDRSKLEIVSISVDNSAEAWRAGIQYHQLPWVNLLDPGAKYSREMLSITSFPFKVLIDASGKIIRINPTKLEIKRYGGRKKYNL